MFQKGASCLCLSLEIEQNPNANIILWQSHLMDGRGENYALFLHLFPRLFDFPKLLKSSRLRLAFLRLFRKAEQ